jgi:hypothetical protein
MTSMQDWEQWQGRWKGEPMSANELRALVDRTTRARAAVAATRVVSGVVAVFALLVVAGALQHAANAIELTLGIVVAIGIITAWSLDASNRRRALDKVESGPEEYAAVRRELCVRRIRFAYLGWIVVTLDFVFLVPWWLGGIKVHGSEFSLMQVETIWGPIAMMIAFVIWTSRVRTVARAELERIA